MPSATDLTPEQREALGEVKAAILMGEREPPGEDTITVAFQTSEGWLDDEGEPIRMFEEVLFDDLPFRSVREVASEKVRPIGAAVVVGVGVVAEAAVYSRSAMNAVRACWRAAVES